MRDSRPLPGTTPVALTSQLAHRVFGPLRRDRVRATLDYHGLAGRPAERVAEVAARHRISNATMTNWAKTLGAAGARLPLSVELATEICRRSIDGEDHLGRSRVAKTFGFPPPTPAARLEQPKQPRLSREDRAAPIAMIRVLAVAGPQTLNTLRASVARTRRHRSVTPTDPQLAAGLLALGAVPDERGRWHAPSHQWTPMQYQSLMMAAAGDRTLTRNTMIAALVKAGYTLTYAEQRAIDRHPLIRRVGPNAYRLIGTTSEPN